MNMDCKTYTDFIREAKNKNDLRIRKSKKRRSKYAPNNPPEGQPKVQGRQETRIGGSTTHFLPEPRAGQGETTAEISHQPPTY